MKIIPLTQGKFAKVDDEDFERVNALKWSLSNGYAHTNKGNSVKGNDHIYMHRFILNPGKGFEIFHKDGDRLNNQKNNFKITTPQQNLMMRKPRKSKTSKYKGVYWDKVRNKWAARIGINRKQKYIGRFDIEEEAALAYDEQAKIIFKEYAYLNFN